MRDETLDNVFAVLNENYYSTKRVVRKKTRLSSDAVDNALNQLIIDGDAEKIFVKNSTSVGRAEAAYRRIID